jgi:hypothetical protein
MVRAQDLGAFRGRGGIAGSRRLHGSLSTPISASSKREFDPTEPTGIPYPPLDASTFVRAGLTGGPTLSAPNPRSK